MLWKVGENNYDDLYVVDDIGLPRGRGGRPSGPPGYAHGG